MLFDKQMNEDEVSLNKNYIQKLLEFKNILIDHPDLYEKLKDQCVITEGDMEHVAHESIPVRNPDVSSIGIEPRRCQRDSSNN